MWLLYPWCAPALFTEKRHLVSWCFGTFDQAVHTTFCLAEHSSGLAALNGSGEMTIGKKGTGKEQRDKDYKSLNWSNTGADLLWSCLSGKGSSALKEKAIAYLKNVNRIPGALIQSNPGETRQFFRHYSAHKYAPPRPEFDSSSAPHTSSTWPANQQRSLAGIHWSHPHSWKASVGFTSEPSCELLFHRRHTLLIPIHKNVLSPCHTLHWLQLSSRGVTETWDINWGWASEVENAITQRQLLYFFIVK